MTHPPGEGHMSDDVLLRFLDGEVTGEMRKHVRAHLRRCGTCLRRAREIRGLLAETDAILAELGSTPPGSLLPRTLSEVRRRRGRPAARGTAAVRRAAAVLLLLAAGAAFASPLRARVLDWAEGRLTRAAQLLGIAPAPARPAEGAAPVPPDPGGAASELRFVPEGDGLRIDFAAAQEHGALLVVSAAEGPSAAFRVADADTARAPVLVLPSEIRVRNAASGRAGYHLSVPRTVDSVAVVVGGGAPVVVHTAGLPPGGRTVPLHGRP